MEPASPRRGDTPLGARLTGPARERAILPLPPGIRARHACFQAVASQKDHPGHLDKLLRPGLPNPIEQKCWCSKLPRWFQRGPEFKNHWALLFKG